MDAHAIARIGFPRTIICLTIETSTVIPRSLNEPECETPHCLMRTSPSPISFAYAGTFMR